MNEAPDIVLTAYRDRLLPWMRKHEGLLLSFYHGVLLGLQPKAAFLFYVFYFGWVLKLSGSSFSLISLSSGLFLLYTLVDYAQRTGLVSDRMERLLIERLKVDPQCLQQLALPPFELEQLASFLAYGQYLLELNGRRLGALYARNAHLYLLFVLVSYLLLHLLLLLIGDGFLFLIIASFPVVWPAMYHYRAIDRIKNACASATSPASTPRVSNSTSFLSYYLNSTSQLIQMGLPPSIRINLLDPAWRHWQELREMYSEAIRVPEDFYQATPGSSELHLSPLHRPSSSGSNLTDFIPKTPPSMARAEKASVMASSFFSPQYWMRSSKAGDETIQKECENESDFKSKKKDEDSDTKKEDPTTGGYSTATWDTAEMRQRHRGHVPSTDEDGFEHIESPSRTT